jgi:endogenous inhibitor of DNA gyrase (YacG/DUF329 family)
MNTAQKEQIRQMRMNGMTYGKVAIQLGLSTNTVKSYCQRNHLGGRKTVHEKNGCKQCGKEIQQTPHRKEKKFCSDKCRIDWWNAHPEKIQHRSVQTFICPVCGIYFTAYSSKNRKYCSRICYGKARKYVL